MSRTYRRQGNNCYQRHGWNKLNHALETLQKIEGGITLQFMPMKKGTVEYNKALAIYYSDKTSNFKEPGPSWFRNMFTERPMRRYNKQELLRYHRIVDYEPMIDTKWPLKYWT